MYNNNVMSLARIIPPPDTPFEAGVGKNWRSIEEELGTRLPEDYKSFINAYGSGRIGGFLWILNPFSSNQVSNLVVQARLRLNDLRELKQDFGDEGCPYPVFPEVGGLIPWGFTDNGDLLLWLAEGESESWPVVISEGRGPIFERYEESTTSFLLKLVSGDIESSIIPRNLIDRSVPFMPPPRGHQ